MKKTFEKQGFFSVPKKDLFQFHERKDAFNLLTPAEEEIEVLSTASTLAPSDDIVRFVTKFLMFRFRFAMVHTEYDPFDLFVDEQKEGLFKSWRHEHRFYQAGWNKDPSSRLVDRIDIAHPLLACFYPFVQNKLKKLFDYRHRVTREELAKSISTKQDAPLKSVIVTGATGLIGNRITEILLEKGVQVYAFVRHPEKAQRKLPKGAVPVAWDFHKPESDSWQQYLERAQGVVHLAGTPLFQQRWSPAFKREMEQSRVVGTKMLADAIAAAKNKPQVFVSASALGIYGTDPERIATEDDKPADDLLARICVNWENEALKLSDKGLRTVLIRIGIVLSTRSGALKELLPVFRAGLGGTMGYPDRYINWIHLEDVARIFVMALFHDQMAGPYNAVGPQPVPNREFAKAIARAVHRPSFMDMPTPMLKLVIGEAGEYAAGGPRASAAKIQQAGYQFFFDSIDAALAQLLQ